MNIRKEKNKLALGKLSRRGNEWNWEQFHKWREKDTVCKYVNRPVIKKDSKVFTIGSCFAENVATYLETKSLYVHHFPDTIHFFSTSILQELKHLLVEPQYTTDDLWTTDSGLYAHPFRKPSFRTNTKEEMKVYSDRIESKALGHLKEADVIIITLGGTETWQDPKTKKPFLTIPYPDVFNTQMPGVAEFHNITFQENYDALKEIYLLLREHVPKADIIMSVSPNRMTFTVSDKDVVEATCQGKSVLRAAVGELTDRYTENLYYFHSYELIEYAKHNIDFLDREQRHVNKFGVSVAMAEFIKYFASDELQNRAEYDHVQQMVKDRAVKYHVPALPFRRRLHYRAASILHILGIRGAGQLYNRLFKYKSNI